MSRAVLCLLLCMAASSAYGLGYEDYFSLPDGSFPGEWAWTGDSQGGGSFLVYDGAFTHVGGGPVYYVRAEGIGRDDLGAFYGFRVKGSQWAFAWRISCDPAAGRCMYLSHDSRLGAWAYVFAEVNWETLDPVEYPEGQYMWHNWTSARVVLHETPGPLLGWHEVWVDDQRDTHVIISVDGEEIFAEDHASIDEGLQGIGCVADGDMTPAFDFLWANWPDPVEPRGWGAIKALFR